MSEPVTLESLPTVLESILFVADKPVEIGLLSRVTGHGADVIGLVVDEIAADWQGPVFLQGDHYQFNLNTRGWAAGAYRFTVILDDGRSYSMDVTLR